MIPVAIFAFLVGAVLAWGFRVWILVPLALLAFLAMMIFGMIAGADFSTAIGHSLVIGALPQFGYAFGLLARTALVVLRSPRKAHAIVGQHRSVNGA
jgi:hypothetical protein